MASRTGEGSLLTAALRRMNLRDTLIGASFISSMLVPLMTDAAKVEKPAEVIAQVMEDVRIGYGYPEQPAASRKPFIFHNGVAIIPVHGILLNRFSYSWGFATGYNFIRSQMNAALADEDVTLIVYDVDSPGGEAVGCFELAEEIRASRAVKPSLAVVDSLAASGGYAVASAATRMVCTPSGSVGSIGVYILHLNMKGALDQMGVEATYIEAGEWKTAGNQFEPLSDEVKADLQKSVDKRWGEFIDLVAANRGISATAVRDTQARVYRADEALALNLIDAVQSPTEAVNAFLAELGGDEIPDETEEDIQVANETTEISAEQRREIEQAATTRIGAILQSPEAKGRESLANHFAFNTALSAEDAVTALKAAPKAEDAKPAEGQGSGSGDGQGAGSGEGKGDEGKGAGSGEGQGKGDEGKGDEGQGEGQGQQARGPSRFEQAMNQSGGAGVGAEGQGGGQGGQGGGDRVSSILASQEALTGKRRKAA